MVNTLLIMEKVSKHYKRKKVIDSFNLQVQRGELITLYGPNGVGKSTLIKMISGFIQPDFGSIMVNGQTIKNNRKRYAKEVAYMPDDFQFPQQFTVMEFLMYYASLRQVPKEKVMDTLKKVGLIDKKDDYLSTLSKGMRQRVLFGQTIFSNASLLLLDEPTNGLDEEWLINLKKLLLMIKKENKSVIFSTHNEHFATKISDYIVHIN